MAYRNFEDVVNVGEFTERITLLQLVELGEQLFALDLADVRALAVDLGLGVGLDLHVYAREAFVELDEIMLDAELAELALDLAAREAGDEAECRAGLAEVAQHDRDIDALAAAEHLLEVDAVYGTGREGIQSDDIVERWIEGHRINHIYSPSMICV